MFAAFDNADSPKKRNNRRDDRPKKPAFEKLSAEELSEDKVKTKLIGNFNGYLQSVEHELNADPFKLYKQNDIPGDKLMFYLLDRVFDKSEEEIRDYFTSYLLKLINAGIFAAADLEKGFS